jgi:steroid delta-isomerase-like uncharacterized protein
MAIIREKLVKDWYAAWNSHDVEKTLGFYADDCVYDSVGSGKVGHGKKELAGYLKTMFNDYPDTKLDFKSTFYSENAVCGEYIFSATQAHSSNPAIPMTGKKFSVRGAYVSEWQNDKVKRHTVYQDYMTVMQQLGVIPAPAKK